MVDVAKVLLRLVMVLEADVRSVMEVVDRLEREVVASRPLTDEDNTPVLVAYTRPFVVDETIDDRDDCLTSPVTWSLTKTIVSDAVPEATVPRYVLPVVLIWAMVVVERVDVPVTVRAVDDADPAEVTVKLVFSVQFVPFQ